MAVIFGTDDDDILRGTADHDTILGLGGGDQLLGEDGNDTLIGGEAGRARSHRGRDRDRLTNVEFLVFLDMTIQVGQVL